MDVIMENHGSSRNRKPRFLNKSSKAPKFLAEPQQPAKILVLNRNQGSIVDQQQLPSTSKLPTRKLDDKDETLDNNKRSLVNIHEEQLSNLQKPVLVNKSLLRRELISIKQNSTHPPKVLSEQANKRKNSLQSIKFLDEELNFNDLTSIEKLLLDSSYSNSNLAPASSIGQTFCIVGAVGFEGVGKSSILNSIANHDVFKTRKSSSNDRDMSGHVTSGIDMHITPERVFLLDTQVIIFTCSLEVF